MIDGKDTALAPRARARRKLFQPAQLDAAGGTRRMHLLDLSETGALANSPEPPPSGSFVSLICGDLRRSARVVWVEGRRFGLAFVMPLSANEVQGVLQLGTKTCCSTDTGDRSAISPTRAGASPPSGEGRPPSGR
ncbi:PilZ domain-containing protein [Sphingomonas sp.]|jgi:hypothetical protein|uniref:PilZ domain-containing protein n=1 Tax=Sphingomonas sp. TaxID=28214 RepID=UPI002D7FC4E3|nr:PilZ domain-containing protein [Sphingomonas sp.]HEU0043205.1 PilZ domain-containing protein [Sphingomonas sp.]